MRVVISASVAGSNRLKDAAGGKMESFLSSKGEESYCVVVGRRVCNERRRDEILLVKKDAKESAMDACGMESGRGLKLPR